MKKIILGKRLKNSLLNYFITEKNKLLKADIIDIKRVIALNRKINYFLGLK